MPSVQPRKERLLGATYSGVFTLFLSEERFAASSIEAAFARVEAGSLGKVVVEIRS
jgi:hypothetical protein